MSSRRGERFLALNDVRLAAYLSAEGESARAAEMERIIVHEVRPLVTGVIARSARGDVPLADEDAHDVAVQITLRMIRKLRATATVEEESIQCLTAYVTTLTQHAIHDIQRRRSPERTRFKSRLRYLLMHDPAFGLWDHDAGATCGFDAWRDRDPVDAPAAAAVRAARRIGSQQPARAVRAVFQEVGVPIRFSHLVTMLVEAWNVVESEPDAPPAAAGDPADDDPLARLTSREYVAALWREIELLPPHQRTALLLNLREPGGGNAVALFALVGAATLSRIAKALGMTVHELAAMWHSLPLDDRTIAARLGVSRQQVINARKSARQRLARRMTR